jgi:predicted transposase YdaD
MFELSDLKQTRVYQEALAEGETKGEVKLVLQLLHHRFGEISPNLNEKIRGLSLVEVENLAKALLDFQSLSDLVSWLER